MFLPGRAVCNPSFQNVFLRIRQHLVRALRWHLQGRIGLRDALIDETGLQVSRHHRHPILPLCKYTFARVQPKISHARVGVRAMAVETVFRQDGPNDPLKIDWRAGGWASGPCRDESQHSTEQNDESQ